jgi:hypothetical protein
MRWKLISWLMRKRALPTFGVTAESIPAIEAEYAELLDRLEAHLDAFPYVLGGRDASEDWLQEYNVERPDGSLGGLWPPCSSNEGNIKKRKRLDVQVNPEHNGWYRFLGLAESATN